MTARLHLGQLGGDMVARCSIPGIDVTSAVDGEFLLHEEQASTRLVQSGFVAMGVGVTSVTVPVAGYDTSAGVFVMISTWGNDGDDHVGINWGLSSSLDPTAYCDGTNLYFSRGSGASARSVAYVVIGY